MQRCETLAGHSELSGGLTRVFLSPQARAARRAGARLDARGGHAGAPATPSATSSAATKAERPGRPCLMLGSHLDTVRDAGKYDGMLGVVTAIECVHALHAKKERLPFAVEVVGFGDEEGVRFGTTLLGSRAIAGTLDPKILDTQDATGKTIAAALSGVRPGSFRAAPGVQEEGRGCGLCRAAHRAGAGSRGRSAAGRGGDGDQRLLSPSRHVAWRSRACRHGTDELAARCPRGRGGMRPGGREHRARARRASSAP